MGERIEEGSWLNRGQEGEDLGCGSSTCLSRPRPPLSLWTYSLKRAGGAPRRPLGLPATSSGSSSCLPTSGLAGERLGPLVNYSTLEGILWVTGLLWEGGIVLFCWNGLVEKAERSRAVSGSVAWRGGSAHRGRGSQRGGDGSTAFACFERERKKRWESQCGCL